VPRVKKRQKTTNKTRENRETTKKRPVGGGQANESVIDEGGKRTEQQRICAVRNLDCNAKRVVPMGVYKTLLNT